MNIVAIMPTRGRTAKAIACLKRLRETAPDVPAVVLTETDPDVVRAETGEMVIDCDPILTAVQKWNMGARVAVRLMGATHLILAADDLWWGDGWLGATGRALAIDAGVVAFNDLHYSGDELGTHYVASVAFCRAHLGGVFVCPHYRSWALDNEMTEIAKRAGVYAWARDAVVEHRHVDYSKAGDDATYIRARPIHYYDRLIYADRQARGFPIDYEAVF